jgi:hypothetical protein
MKLSTLALLVFCAASVSAEELAIALSGSAQPNCWRTEDTVAALTRGATSDREKALAIHKFGMQHIIHFIGPFEERGEYLTDPLKVIGVYGYALCMNNSSSMCGLYETAGLKCRVRTMIGHTVPEVWFEGRWNYIDTDMFGYVFLPDGKRMANVDDLFRDPDLFVHQTHPPEPFYPFDEKTAMADTFREARTAVKDHHPFPNSHMMNLELRTGESVSLYYRPKDRFLLTAIDPPNMGTMYTDYWTLGPVRKGSLAWRDGGPAAYGNGLFNYKPDLRSEAFRLENPEASGLTVRKGGNFPTLAAAEQGKPASLVVDVNLPWIIAGLQNDLTTFDDDSDGAVVSGVFWRLDASDRNRISVSVDGGHTWKQVWENHYMGSVPFQLDLTRWAKGEYAYKIKFEWTDAKGTGKVGLADLQLRNWVELSPMALPRIAAGENKFQLATAPHRTFYNASRWDRGQAIVGEERDNFDVADAEPYLRPRDAGRPGTLIFPLGPAGQVEETRISVLARTLPGGKPADVAVALSLSTDGGVSWKELERYKADREHEIAPMWFNHVIRNADLRGDSCRLKVAVSGGGLSKVIANSAVRATPKSPAALRVTHLWKEGDKSRNFSQEFAPGAAGRAYSITAGPGVFNEELRLEAIPAK